MQGRASPKPTKGKSTQTGKQQKKKLHHKALKTQAQQRTFATRNKRPQQPQHHHQQQPPSQLQPQFKLSSITTPSFKPHTRQFSTAPPPPPDVSSFTAHVNTQVVPPTKSTFANKTRTAALGAPNTAPVNPFARKVQNPPNLTSGNQQALSSPAAALLKSHVQQTNEAMQLKKKAMNRAQGLQEEGKVGTDTSSSETTVSEIESDGFTHDPLNFRPQLANRWKTKKYFDPFQPPKEGKEEVVVDAAQDQKQQQTLDPASLKAEDSDSNTTEYDEDGRVLSLKDRTSKIHKHNYMRIGDSYRQMGEDQQSLFEDIMDSDNYPSNEEYLDPTTGTIKTRPFKLLHKGEDVMSEDLATTSFSDFTDEMTEQDIKEAIAEQLPKNIPKKLALQRQALYKDNYLPLELSTDPNDPIGNPLYSDTDMLSQDTDDYQALKEGEHLLPGLSLTRFVGFNPLNTTRIDTGYKTLTASEAIKIPQKLKNMSSRHISRVDADGELYDSEEYGHPLYSDGNHLRYSDSEDVIKHDLKDFSISEKEHTDMGSDYEAMAYATRNSPNPATPQDFRTVRRVIKKLKDDKHVIKKAYLRGVNPNSKSHAETELSDDEAFKPVDPNDDFNPNDFLTFGTAGLPDDQSLQQIINTVYFDNYKKMRDNFNVKLELPRLKPGAKIPKGWMITEDGFCVPESKEQVHHKYADPDLYDDPLQTRLKDLVNNKLPAHMKFTPKEQESFMEVTQSGIHAAYQRHPERVLNSPVINDVIARINARKGSPTQNDFETNIDLKFKTQNVNPFYRGYRHRFNAQGFAFLDIPLEKIEEVRTRSRALHRPPGPSMDYSFLSTGYHKARH